MNIAMSALTEAIVIVEVGNTSGTLIQAPCNSAKPQAHLVA
jgi:hypothetical protein